MAAMNGFECSRFTALLMLIQKLLQIAVAAETTTNNNGSESPEDWKGCEGRYQEEASTIWHGG
jgi:hypothetical protein